MFMPLGLIVRSWKIIFCSATRLTFHNYFIFIRRVPLFLLCFCEAQNVLTFHPWFDTIYCFGHYTTK